MNERPFVSVIVPVYNGALYLRNALESIRRQDYPSLEVIVVDDGSTDGTSKIAKGFKGDIKYIYQKNLGPAAARNTGLGIAKGSTIGFLDADDIWPEKRLKLQLEYLMKDPSLGIVIGRVQRIQKILGETEEPRFEKFYEPQHAFLLASALFRRSVFDKVGLFNPSLRYSEDVEWFMLAREKGVLILMIDDISLLYRFHGNSMTYGKDPVDLNVVRVFKRSLDRRRQNRLKPDISLPKMFRLKDE